MSFQQVSLLSTSACIRRPTVAPWRSDGTSLCALEQVSLLRQTGEDDFTSVFVMVVMDSCNVDFAQSGLVQ